MKEVFRHKEVWRVAFLREREPIHFHNESNRLNRFDRDLMQKGLPLERPLGRYEGLTQQPLSGREWGMGLEKNYRWSWTAGRGRKVGLDKNAFVDVALPGRRAVEKKSPGKTIGRYRGEAI
jgi:hypothetical protein